MFRRRSMRGAGAALVGSALALSVAGASLAHVSSTVQEGAAGSTVTTAFRVGHGCEGSPTTSISIQMPEGVTGVTPQWMPGWELEAVKGPVTPYDSHGETVAEDVVEITWSGGSLPDGAFLEFGVRLTLPDAAGETLYFPVVQRCETGETAWTQIPDASKPDEELERPAAAIEVTEAANSDDGDDSGGAESSDDGDSDSSDSTARTLSTVALGLGAVGIVLGVRSRLARK